MAIAACYSRGHRRAEHERRGIEEGAIGVVNAADEARQCVAVGSLRRPQDQRFGRQGIPAMAIFRRRSLPFLLGPSDATTSMKGGAFYEASSPLTWSVSPASSMFKPGKRAAQPGSHSRLRNRFKARNKRCLAPAGATGDVDAWFIMPAARSASAPASAGSRS